MKKKFLVLVSLITLGTSLSACTEAEKVSYNVSQEADNFNVVRRVAVINTRTDKVEFEVIGNISVDTSDENKLVIIAETGKDTYKKHLVNMTDWNMYVVEDLEGADVNKYKYEVNYRVTGTTKQKIAVGFGNG
ncbi:TPA: hypothetical protein ACN1M9_002605 [Enterococcus faecalis]|uniref:beta-sandwich lipoprotein n=1 Tax=Enterococcus faecalis TaxID=1351 RepID=UPI0003534D43|nr:hypothetical protein [Enterococcus faecalis]EKF8800514.1 hypothetical protein [Enterococcus faecalis]EPI34819.1 hypothetical protein D349_00047 [Enterococcus faecalis UP2S-6]MDN3109346.1 hypothetical protein [Enterococcus faecalis]MEB8140984.1 hypothetical protein [Enterococcus faecalis]TBH14581.1 hypothetical protein EYC52_14410 [Enterococcus faecalis]